MFPALIIYVIIAWLYNSLIGTDSDPDLVACRPIALLKFTIEMSTRRGRWLCCPVVLILLLFISALIDAITGQNSALFFWFSHTKYLNNKKNYVIVNKILKFHMNNFKLIILTLHCSYLNVYNICGINYPYKLVNSAEHLAIWNMKQVLYIHHLLKNKL